MFFGAMSVSALFVVLTFASISNGQWDVPGVPVPVLPDSVMNPETAIDMNNRESHVDKIDITNGTNIFNLTAPFNSTNLFKTIASSSSTDLFEITNSFENETINGNTHRNETTAVDSVMHPKASLRIDLNNRESHVDNVDTSNGSNAFNLTALINSRDPAENELKPHRNEITALTVWRNPEAVVFKPYSEDESTSVKRHISPREALQDVVKRMEEQTPERVHNVYLAIGEFNDCVYQTYQQFQYLSYSENEKQKKMAECEILKDRIMPRYVKVRVFIKALERYRAKLTCWCEENKPSADFCTSSVYWPQPEKIPEVWYLLYNIETIIMQLFTPKPQIHTFLNETTHLIQMMRAPTVQMIPRSFLPVPQYNIHNNNALDRLFGMATKAEDASNEFEQATFSKDVYEQQVLVFFMHKYFEYKSGDLARHVTYISDKLQELKSNTSASVLIKTNQLKELLAVKLTELQHATIQMETYRTNSELMNVYNAEANAMRFLPGSKHITKLIGGPNKRVAIKARDEAVTALENGATTDVVTTTDDRDIDPTAELPKPLEWDKNWPWDF